MNYSFDIVFDTKKDFRLLIILKTISPFFTQYEFFDLHNKKLYVNYSTQGYICKPYKTHIKKEKFVVSLNYLSVLKNSLIVKVSKQPTLFSKVMYKFYTIVFY